MQGRRNAFYIGEGHEMLKKYYRSILLFVFCVWMHCFIVPCVLCRSCVKSKENLSSFQQGVHPLPVLEKFLFSLNYLKRSFFLFLHYKVCKTTFLSRYIFWRFHQKILFTSQTIGIVSSVFFEVAEYKLISER